MLSLAVYSETHPNEPRLLLGIARIQDMLANSEAAAVHYKRVLRLNASHVESIACLAANHFYNDQVSVSLPFLTPPLSLSLIAMIRLLTTACPPLP